jgi:hypothetical protein
VIACGWNLNYLHFRIAPLLTANFIHVKDEMNRIIVNHASGHPEPFLSSSGWNCHTSSISKIP